MTMFNVNRLSKCVRTSFPINAYKVVRRRADNVWESEHAPEAREPIRDTVCTAIAQRYKEASDKMHDYLPRPERNGTTLTYRLGKETDGCVHGGLGVFLYRTYKRAHTDAEFYGERTTRTEHGIDVIKCTILPGTLVMYHEDWLIASKVYTVELAMDPTLAEEA